ncbi:MULTISPECIES: MoaD/ThiS family protein [Paenibacillus]|jgi:molybdopterin synthase sulfur carrier subunit|uniref:MoaD/ThiS family protein n=1 Tax=Paenibacillus TaxID=44249 RepID=UPI00042EB2AB|nr:MULTISPECIES: MoaD/ThiS family protein [Paenibacillus]AHM67254.1 molybdopterin converting factor [Paenibacillus polymyxa SQR-21]AIY08043.1 molybdopterin converting factor [Paenibacillus polymyxa]KAF6586006.1 MoaD/ThiS family protein [Paenibacillus sp. EKM211P]MBY0022809.1 MoaD/ThiS family protein [Paenibacillus polymyxa]MBY0057016.1 MoaD/ThiS family protein [Paenibacillus polymyxa]
MIKLYYFAGLREVTGKFEEMADLAGQTVGELYSWITDKYPGMPINSTRIAVNEEYALLTDVLQDGDIAAFIPPVSGG